MKQPSFAQRMTGKSAFIDDDMRFMTKKKNIWSDVCVSETICFWMRRTMYQTNQIKEWKNEFYVVSY